MKVYPSDIADLAKSFHGYLEKESNHQLYDSINNYGNENYTKFAYEMDHQFFKWYKEIRNGKPWGGLFVEYCFVATAGIDESYKRLHKTSLPSEGYDIEKAYLCYLNAGAIYQEPMIGDQIFFKDDNGKFSHTGIVTAVSEEYVATVEGDVGNTVSKVQYLLNDKSIFGYGRPIYDKLSEDEDCLSFHVTIPDSPYTWWAPYNVLNITNAKVFRRLIDMEIITYGAWYYTDAGSIKVYIRDEWGEFLLGETSTASNGRYQIPDDRPVDVIVTNKRGIMGLVGPERPYHYYKNWEINIRQFYDMPNLYDLVFCNSSVYGNIEVFESCPKLMILDLSRSNVTGSIKDYSMYKYLQSINLNSTGVDFEIEEGKVAKTLTKLYLAGTHISNNIRGFRELNNLRELDVSGAKMDGTGYAYRFMNMLRRLTLKEPGLVGNIDTFTHHFDMQRLNLDGLAGAGDYWPPVVWRKMKKEDLAKIFVSDTLGSLTGMQFEGNLGNIGVDPKIKSIVLKDIASHGSLDRYVELRTGDNFRYVTKFDKHWKITLQRIKCLEGISVIRCPITGDIPKKLYMYPNFKYLHLCKTEMHFPTDQLSKFYNLTQLTLQDFDIYGDIKAFEPLTNLRLFNLKGTNIVGDIEVLNNCYNLEQVIICKPNVEGSIASWTNLEFLKYLSLRMVKTISGNMEDFEPFKRLETLHLMRCTSLEGDIAALAKLPKLKNLYIMDCPKIYGNLSSFAKFPKLERLCIFTPKIKGTTKTLRQMKFLRFFAYGDRINQGWWNAI